MTINEIFQALVVEVSQLNNQKRYAETASLLEKLVIETLNLLSLTQSNQKNYVKAIEALQVALGFDEKNWILWTNICHFLNVQDKYTEAKEASLKAVEYAKDFQAHYNHGVILQNLDETKFFRITPLL